MNIKGTKGDLTMIYYIICPKCGCNNGTTNYYGKSCKRCGEIITK